MARVIGPLLLLMALAACGSEPARFNVPAETSQIRVKTRAATISLAEVSLPSYSEEATITLEDETGAVVPLANAVWADDPQRAMTNALVRNLSAITKRPVASEPWPLDGVPEAELRVRVERMIVTVDNVLVLSGQFAVRREADEDDEGQKSASESTLDHFTVSVPVVAVTPLGILRAHDAAWRQLAERLAKAL